MTHPDLAAALKTLRLAFPGGQATAETLVLYADRLADLDPADVVAAIDRLINTAKPKYGNYFPSIAEIRELAVVGGTTDGAAELAWAEVLREVRRVGWNNRGFFRDGVHHDPPKPQFSSAITEAAVESVTWRMICLSEEPERVREQFLWTWKNLASRAIKQAANGDPLDVLPASNLRVLPREGIA